MPMSAARPISTSFTANLVSFAHIRTSAQTAISIPKPKHQPLIAAMTGFVHFSMEVMAAWKSSMCRRSCWAVRAVSSFDVRWGFRVELEDEKAWTSRPAVKALEPAPERMTARVEGDVERWEKRGESSAQTLLD